MQSIPKKVKGFTILEVIIVLTLVGIISAIGIPNFNSWNKDRVVRAEAERVRREKEAAEAAEAERLRLE